jgi:hypothetical protein
MNIKNIIVGLFGKNEIITEAAYANIVETLGSIASNVLDMAAAVPYVKLTYGSDRQSNVKVVRDIGATLIVQLSGVTTTFASWSELRVTKLAPTTPENIIEWCRTTHQQVIMLLEICAAKGRDVVKDEQACKLVSSLNKMHDVLTSLLSE